MPMILILEFLMMNSMMRLKVLYLLSLMMIVRILIQKKVQRSCKNYCLNEQITIRIADPGEIIWLELQ